MGEHDGHRERLKERFFMEGLDSFQPHEVLEMLLFFTIPRQNTNELGHRLIDHFGSLHAVFDADPSELLKVKGVGMNSATLIHMIPQLSRYYRTDRWGEKPRIRSPRELGMYAINLFEGRTDECFMLICLDAQEHVIAHPILNEGTINQAHVYPRKVVETALRYHASTVAIAHNHPGGGLMKSKADEDATDSIAAALAAVNIALIDHIIVAGDKFFSNSREQSYTERGTEYKAPMPGRHVSADCAEPGDAE